ncbi:DNA polymerase [Alkalicoccus urumqiensis]|uniref:DNA polymerase n=1 Tax=Alkalicoccus urumqiensis TaxID=1548213 RepID=UPI0015E61722|nr:DNA polymerase [Alkalicoccus urumqiensis]
MSLLLHLTSSGQGPKDWEEAFLQREGEPFLEAAARQGGWNGEGLLPDSISVDAQEKTMRHLEQELRTELEKNGLSRALQIEEEALPAIVEVQRTGLYLNQSRWQALKQQKEQEVEALEADIRRLLQASDLNVQSPQQLLQAFRSAEVPLSSTEEKVLKRNKNGHPAIALLLQCRKARQITNTLNQNFASTIGEDGRVRGQWNPVGAVTGRMSCSKPNLQGLGREVKSCFEAEPGHVLVQADFRAIELRVLAHIAGEGTLITLFEEGRDLHQETAARIFQRPVEEVSDMERKTAKIITFGVVFGMTAQGLQGQLQSDAGLHYNEMEAGILLEAFLDSYPNVRRLQEYYLKTDCIRSLAGRVWTTDHVPLGERPRLNYPVQASAAEGMKRALTRCYNDLKPGWKLAAVIHDEILLEVPEEEADEAATFLETAMVQGMSELIPTVPVAVEIQCSRRWREEEPATSATAATSVENDRITCTTSKLGGMDMKAEMNSNWKEEQVQAEEEAVEQELLPHLAGEMEVSDDEGVHRFEEVFTGEVYQATVSNVSFSKNQNEPGTYDLILKFSLVRKTVHAPLSTKFIVGRRPGQRLKDAYQILTGEGLAETLHWKSLQGKNCYIKVQERQGSKFPQVDIVPGRETDTALQTEGVVGQ